MLGFILRCTKFSLVRFKLEYAIFIYYAGIIEAIERKLLKYLRYKISSVFPPRGFAYNTFLFQPNVSSLENWNNTRALSGETLRFRCKRYYSLFSLHYTLH